MTESLFQIGISNAILAGLMAFAAILVGVTLNRPKLTHCIWLLVLIKLVTPPIFHLPIPTFGAPPEPLIALNEPAIEFKLQTDQNWSPNPAQRQSLYIPADVELKKNETGTKAENSNFGIIAIFLESVKSCFGMVWLGGTTLILIGSLFQILRFHRLLQANRMIAGKDILRVAKRIQKQLSMKNLPMISITNARISPMVWWVGGRVHVIMPQVVIEETKREQWQWILAHEMAHVSRRDYLVRWLEWLACVCFWWNPIFWLAQRNLRAAEEICCDELVVRSLNANSYSYANSILAAVESLVIPEFRPPAMASEMNSGGFLKRRINMILNGGSKPSSLRSVQFLIAGMAILLIPIGFVQAQDFDAIKKRLTKAVKQNEITLKQAAIMMEALREAREHDEHEHDEHDYHEHEYEHGEHEEEHGEHEHAESDHGYRHGEEVHELKRSYTQALIKFNQWLAAHEAVRFYEDCQDAGIDMNTILEAKRAEADAQKGFHEQREMHEREMHEREMHEREMHEREMHEREMHEREMHEREMHERAELKLKKMRELELRERELRKLELLEREMLAKEMQERVQHELEMRDREIDRYRAEQEAMRAELEAVHAKLAAEMAMLEKAKAKSMSKKTHASRKDAELEAKYKALIQKLEAAVRVGDISKQDAKKRMDEYRYKLWPESREKKN